VTISALDDLTPEQVQPLRDQAKREHAFKRVIRRKYRGRSDDFFRGYMAYATGFRPEKGALWYEVMPEMAMGWLCAQRDKATTESEP
jgi:hypothetical protein